MKYFSLPPPPRQEKKEQEERERQQRLAEGAKESANHVRNLEAASFEKLLKEHSLEIVEVMIQDTTLFGETFARETFTNLNIFCAKINHLFAKIHPVKLRFYSIF